MAQGDYRVKGSSIRSKFEFVRERYGVEAESRLIQKFKSRPEITPLLDTAWYPFAIYEEINQAIVREFFSGDVARLREVGSYSASLALRTTYRAYALGKDFVQFLRGTGVYYQTFYDRGDVQVTVSDDRRAAELKFSGAPLYTETDLQVAVGFFVEAGRILGVSNITGTGSFTPKGTCVRLHW